MTNSKKYADEKQALLWKKFPSSHFLSNPENTHHVFLWTSFFRRNLHRFAIDYLGINLHTYQAIALYLMGISHFFVTIATRSASKSLILALYSCSVCILYPDAKFVVGSATKGQAKLIVTEKIKNELMGMSSALRREILNIKDNQNDVIIYFRNGSTLRVVPALESSRGNRSTHLCREEFRQIKKSVDDSIFSPFQIVRHAGYMTDDYYNGVDELKEEPVDIYIGSSWFDKHEYMWDIVGQALNGMLQGESSFLLAFDESIVLKHGIKTKKQLIREKKKQDPLTWRIEYLNERVKENAHAYFSYETIAKNQRLKKVFYPRSAESVRLKHKNPYSISKQNGEIRILACDMAFVENKNNDNSIFSCMRLLPETISYKTSEKNLEINNGYRRQVPYMESVQGGDITKQALRIRQLFEDFEADYIVLDVRNAGIAVYDLLAKVMYDEERDIEYSPLTCMNNDDIAKRVKIAGAQPVIFAVTASQKMNSDIAICMKNTLETGMIDFLVNFSTAEEELLPNVPEWKNPTSVDVQLFYEKPYFETQEFVSETVNLTYEKKEQTGAVIISEQGNNRKDRYTSVSYGNYFASLLEQDLIFKKSTYDFCVLVN